VVSVVFGEVPEDAVVSVVRSLCPPPSSSLTHTFRSEAAAYIDNESILSVRV
jgi:hypothetical protein